MNDRNTKGHGGAPAGGQAIEEFRRGSTALAPAEATSSREIAAVQAAMVIAKRFPRDEAAAFTRIKRACSRKALAEHSMYAYPRGGATVTGPSIRLAEVLAQNWGNLEFGIRELEQRGGESVVEAFCWDLETNVRQTKIFTVKHERGTRSGVQRLSDPRDIYEMVANQGARRVRACILGVIPGDIVDEAIRTCESTLKGDSSEPLADRIRNVVAAFDEQGVTQAMLEKRLGHVLGTTGEVELVGLRKIYLSLRDGMAKPADFFAVEAAPSNLDALTKKMEQKAAQPADAPQAAPPPPQPQPQPKREEEPPPPEEPPFSLAEPGSDPHEPPPFDDAPPARARATNRKR